MVNEIHVAGEPNAGVQRCVRCTAVLIDVRGEVQTTGPGALPRGPQFFEEGVFVIEGAGSFGVTGGEGLEPTCAPNDIPAPKLYKAPDGRLREAIQLTPMTRAAVNRFVRHHWKVKAREVGATVLELQLASGRTIAVDGGSWLVVDPLELAGSPEPTVRVVDAAVFAADYEVAS